MSDAPFPNQSAGEPDAVQTLRDVLYLSGLEKLWEMLSRQLD